MNKKDVKNLVRFGIKALGGIGAVKIVRNITPYEGVIGTIACGTFAFFAAMAAQDMIDGQMMKCEAILQQLANNGGDMVVF